MSFGKRLKDARIAKDLTQKQLAELVRAKHNSISNWENNVNKPDPDTIELLCGTLDITPNYLLAPVSNEVSPADKLLLKKYHELDPHGKEMVILVLEKERERSLKILDSDITDSERRSPDNLLGIYRTLSHEAGQVFLKEVAEYEDKKSKEYKKEPHQKAAENIAQQYLDRERNKD